MSTYQTERTELIMSKTSLPPEKSHAMDAEDKEYYDHPALTKRLLDEKRNERRKQMDGYRIHPTMMVAKRDKQILELQEEIKRLKAEVIDANNSAIDARIELLDFKQKHQSREEEYDKLADEFDELDNKHDALWAQFIETDGKLMRTLDKCARLKEKTKETKQLLYT